MMNEASISDESEGEDVQHSSTNHCFSAPSVSLMSANSGVVSDDDLQDAESTSVSCSLPLIPSDCDDVHEALENFLRVFEARYGDKHPFFNPMLLTDAIHDLQISHYAGRKPILMYIHDDNSVMSQLFCTQVLCAPAMIDFINSNFLLWGWDFTVDENRTKLIDWIENSLGHQRSLKIRVCTRQEFPVLVILGKVTGGVEIIDVIKNAFLLEEVMVKLLGALDTCQEQSSAEAAEELERNKRQLMLNEQENAYKESLEADRLKAELRLKEEKSKKAEEERRLTAELEKEKARLVVESRLLPEPSESGGQPQTKIRIRNSNGSILERRFLLSQPLSHLFDFLTSKSFALSEYRLLTSFPKRDLTTLDSKKTFTELKFGPREMIVMEPKD